jgi:hypothetical protein
MTSLAMSSSNLICRLTDWPSTFTHESGVDGLKSVLARDGYELEVLRRQLVAVDLAGVLVL